MCYESCLRQCNIRKFFVTDNHSYDDDNETIEGSETTSGRGSLSEWKEIRVHLAYVGTSRGLSGEKEFLNDYSTRNYFVTKSNLVFDCQNILFFSVYDYCSVSSWLRKVNSIKQFTYSS